MEQDEVSALPKELRELILEDQQLQVKIQEWHIEVKQICREEELARVSVLKQDELDQELQRAFDQQVQSLKAMYFCLQSLVF